MLRLGGLHHCHVLDVLDFRFRISACCPGPLSIAPSRALYRLHKLDFGALLCQLGLGSGRRLFNVLFAPPFSFCERHPPDCTPMKPESSLVKKEACLDHSLKLFSVQRNPDMSGVMKRQWNRCHEASARVGHVKTRTYYNSRRALVPVRTTRSLR